MIYFLSYVFAGFIHCNIFAWKNRNREKRAGEAEVFFLLPGRNDVPENKFYSLWFEV